ncbi:uncharacterized protein A4U43_C08F21980 [Asparagus officinalis]|nr:uncharacterized protein A4U43_C08F21980 [Asparagus officinalis]
MVLDSFVGRCLSLLNQLATEEVVMILGVKDELQRFAERLGMIKDMLSDAEQRRIHDAAINCWLSNLRGVMYDADDIIDLCIIKGCEFLKGGGDHRNHPPHQYAAIGSLSFHALYFSKCSIPSQNCMNINVTHVNLRQSSPLPNSDIVGVEAKIVSNKLVVLIVQSVGESMVVFAIVGLGGIELLPLLRSVLVGKRFFLVLDGVWRSDLWENSLQSPVENRGIQDLQGIRKQIVKKCDNLPQSKPLPVFWKTKDRSKREWEKVQKSQAWSVKGELPESGTGALSLGYKDVPSQLKQCFLRCSLYPEDYVFRQMDLVRLPPLGRLPKLRVLTIEGASAVVTIGQEFHDVNTKKRPAAFPKLEKLLIYSMPN